MIIFSMPISWHKGDESIQVTVSVNLYEQVLLQVGDSPTVTMSAEDAHTMCYAILKATR